VGQIGNLRLYLSVLRSLSPQLWHDDRRYEDTKLRALSTAWCGTADKRAVKGAAVDLGMSESTIESQLVLTVVGEVDVHSAPHLRDRLFSLIDAGAKSLVVDLSKLGFIDSTGLGALVAARNHAEKSSAALRLVCSSERLLKLFRITGLHEVFAIYPSLSQAAASGASGTLPTAKS
jgi:anti-sigma B factor antagonist